jgi:hypothetical protein
MLTAGFLLVPVFSAEWGPGVVAALVVTAAPEAVSEWDQEGLEEVSGGSGQ